MKISSKYLSYFLNIFVENFTIAKLLISNRSLLRSGLQSPSHRSVLITVCRVTFTPMDTISSTISFLNIFHTSLQFNDCTRGYFPLFYFLILDCTELTGTLNCIEIFLYLLPHHILLHNLVSKLKRAFCHPWRSAGLEGRLLVAWLFAALTAHLEVFPFAECYLYVRKTFLHLLCKLIVPI